MIVCIMCQGTGIKRGFTYTNTNEKYLLSLRCVLFKTITHIF